MINLCDRTRRRRARARAGFVYSRLEELFFFFSFLSLFFSQSKNGRRRIGLTSGEARLRRRRGRRFNSGYTPRRFLLFDRATIYGILSRLATYWLEISSFSRRILSYRGYEYRFPIFDLEDIVESFSKISSTRRERFVLWTI